MLCRGSKLELVKLVLQYGAHPEGEHFRAWHCVRRQATADLASRSSPPKRKTLNATQTPRFLNTALTNGFRWSRHRQGKLRLNKGSMARQATKATSGSQELRVWHLPKTTRPPESVCWSWR